MNDWLSSFAAYCEDRNAPELFKRWAGIYVLAAGLQRKVWIKSRGEAFYPHLYVVLCGPSASGKGVAIDPAKKLLLNLSQQFVAPSSLTGAALADELDEATTTFLDPQNRPVQYNALTVVAQEFGVFLPAYDYPMLNILTDVYDCKGYSERRRGSNKKIAIPNAHLNILGGTTPDYLNNVLPENAWNEGFMSRVILVYSGAVAPTAITEEAPEENDSLVEGLKADLETVCSRYGWIRFEPAALTEINRWYTGGQQPRPSHPKLLSYCGRRMMHLFKLSLIHCMSRNGTAISVDDFALSLDLLLETENIMPDAFKAMRTGGDQQAIKEAFHYIMQMFGQKQKPVPHHKLISFLSERVPAHSVDRIAQNMVAARLLKQTAVVGHGVCYIPLGKLSDD